MKAEEEVIALIKRGTEQQLAGNFQEAENLYKEILKDEDRPVVHNNLGFLFLQKNTFTDAITEFRKAIRLKADYTTAWKHLGYAYLLSGESQLAIEATKKCFELDPTDAEVAENLAKLYLISNQWHLSAYYRKCAYELSGDLEQLIELAYANLMENKLQNVVDVLRYVIFNMDSGSARIYTILGTAYMLSHNLGLASSNFKEALGLEPEHIEARNNMALCLLQTGNTADAMFEFQRVLMLEPNHFDARNNLAVLEIAAGNKKSALQHFDFILMQQPGNAKALYYKSGLLYQDRKFDEVQTLLEKIISIEGNEYQKKAQEMLLSLTERTN